MVQTGEAVEGVVRMAALGIASASELTRWGMTNGHFIDLIRRIWDDISHDLGYVEISTNELPRSLLRGIKNSEYRSQESGEEQFLLDAGFWLLES